MIAKFISGTRQVLVLQLIIAVVGVAVAAWSLGVTSDLLRERERLRTRVAQLEETLVSNDIVVPSTATVVETPAQQRARDVYPPSAPQAAAETTTVAATGDASGFNPGQVIGDLFTPAPAMRIVVVHVRNEAEARIAAPIAEALAQTGEVQTLVAQMPARDPRQAGYVYFDGRQSSAAATLVQLFHDSARQNDVAPWSAQLRGEALPAQGEYAADRMDIVLPPLTPAQAQRLDPAPPVAAAATTTAPAPAPPVNR